MDIIDYWLSQLEHVKCHCGGILGMYDRGASGYCTCERCGAKTKIDYCDDLMINDKTGWIFPMVRKKKGD